MSADVAQPPARATELLAAFTSGTRICRHSLASHCDRRPQQMPLKLFLSRTPYDNSSKCACGAG